MRRDALWLVLVAALVAVLVWWHFFSLKSVPARPDEGLHGSAVMMSRRELSPDSDPPTRAQLMYISPPFIPVNVKTERKGDAFTIDLYDHGELFDFEKYVSNADGFSVAQAAGEEYVPAIPILQFPLDVGGPPLSWQGTLSSELSPHRARAKIQIWAEKIVLGDRPVSTVRSDVEIFIDAHDRMPETQRRLSFWFQPGRGLIKRQFGTTSSREPVGP